MNNMIGSTLRLLRQRENLTMEELADKIGVTRQSVAKWENDESLPDLMKCNALATLYGITIDAIINSSFSEITEKAKDGERYIFGFSKIGARGQIVLPIKARTIFELNPGDSILVLGDKSRNGLALVKVDVVDDLIKW